MKLLFILLMLPVAGITQVMKTKSFDFHIEQRCAVAHFDDKGNMFTCDYNENFFPAHIQDASITKWFVKMEGKDSLFYYRHIVIDTFIWNGKPKDKLYGYESIDKSTLIPHNYTKDTITFNRQVWRSR